MSPFVMINSLARKPILRWIVTALVLAGLLLFTSRAWSAPADVVISDEPGLTLALSASPATFTITQGAGGASTIAVTTAFNGKSSPEKPITLTASGLPCGVNASFTPVDEDGHSTMLVDAPKNAPTGVAHVTINAAEGKSTASATIDINIIGPTDPDFAPSVQPGRVEVNRGSDNDCSILLTPVNGFAGPVTLTVNGVPSGVTATFDPATTTSTSVLHVSAAEAASVSGTPVTITATSGAITHTARILLAVQSRPDFTVGAWNDSVSIQASSLGTDTIKINPLNGFARPVKFTTEDVPDGITAGFSPSVADNGSSTLLLTAASTVKKGQSSLTIVATSGKIVRRRTITINVAGDHDPTFALNSWPAALTVLPGGRTANTVTVIRQNGFDGLVDLSISGLPDGVTATFSPSSTHGSSTLTISARSDFDRAIPIQATVTGLSNGITQTTNLTLSVGARETVKTAAAAQPGDASQPTGPAQPFAAIGHALGQ